MLNFIFIKDNIGFVRDIATTCAAIGAIYGLTTWKRQLRANAEYAIVKNALTSLYELREAIDLARNGFQYYCPDLTQEEWNKLDDQQKKWLPISEGYIKRWEKIAIAEQKFKTSLIDIETIWGREPLAKVEPLLNLIRDLYFAISEHHLYTLKRILKLADYNEEEFKQMKIHEKTCFKGFRGDNDEYMKKLENTILDIENMLRPIIQKYHAR